jgi:hypothetical protein
MRHSFLRVYQWSTALSDTVAGVLLCIAPAFTLRRMGVHVPDQVLPYIGYIGAFVLSVGFSCLYGALLVERRALGKRLEVVWLLTAFSRSAVALYVIKCIATAELGYVWLLVAFFDAACVIIQGIGLRRRWFVHECA